MPEPVTRERVRAESAAHLGIDAAQLTPSATLGEDLGVDSLTAVELSMKLEEAYGISISDEELTEVSTYGDLEALVMAKVGDR